MQQEKKLVLPGDEIGHSEEYMAGENTYEDEGKIRSAVVGKVEIDTKEREVKVTAFNPPVFLKNNDFVIGIVTETKSAMAVVEIIKVVGVERHVSTLDVGAIHVSKIAPGYVKSVDSEFQMRDIIRAKVMQAKPSVQLTTVDNNLGVIKSKCSRCRGDMIKKGNRLYCEPCDRYEHRKIAEDYGEAAEI
jgi:exosome complex component CSL4